MKASGTQLFNLLQGQQHFMIPLFQRTYSWSKENFENLWNDVMEVYEAEVEERHFLGSIVTKSQDATPEGVSPFLAIDGQQRLTTLTLLLAALRDVIRPSEPQLAKKIHQLYLTNEFASDFHSYKVLPTQADRAVYTAIVNGDPGEVIDGSKSRAREAYEYFTKRISGTDPDGQSLDLRRLERIISSGLEIVSITLDDSDNEYRIFESLNATGMPLTQADLIRNYFFMRIPSHRHEEIYNHVWLPMQNSLGGALENFFRYEWMSGGQFVREADIYVTWKRRLDPLGADDLIERLRYLAHNARFYKRLLAPSEEPDGRISNGLARLNRWGGQTVYPFLLNVYRRYDVGEVDAESFANVLRTLESFLIRRFVVRIPTNQLNRLFMRLAYQLPEGHDFPEAVRIALSDPGRRWPRDEDFHEALLRFPLYTEGRYEQRRIILETLERDYGSKELIDLSALNIEHILPQTLTNEWKEALGEDAEEIHAKMVHLLGNLTLTGYNSELSNSSFGVKRDLFAQSNVEMNKEIALQSEWASAEISERGRRLAERALEIWQGPSI